MSDEPSGVRGWLLLLVLGLTIFGPIGGVLQLLSSLAVIEGLSQDWPGVSALFVFDALLVVGLTVLMVVAGVCLWRRRAVGVTLTKAFLLGQLARGSYITVVLLNLSAPYSRGRSVLGGAGVDRTALYMLLVLPSLAFVFWYLYLERSRRVRNTYGGTAYRATAGLADVNDLSQVLQACRRLPIWIAAGFVAGSWAGWSVGAAIRGQVWTLPGSYAVVATGLAAYVVLGPCFAAILKVGWAPWQQVAAWALVVAVVQWLRGTAVSAWMSPMSFLDSTVSADSWSSPRTVLFAVLFQVFFLFAVLAATRRWGIRLWSLVAGAAVAEILADTLLSLVQWSMPTVLDLLVSAASGAVSGALLYVGVRMQVAYSASGDEPAA